MGYLSKVSKAMKEGGVLLIFERLFKKIRWSFERRSYLMYVKHKLTKRLPKVDVQLRPLAASPNDAFIAERILRAFNKARKDENKDATGDIWDQIQEKHGDFYAIHGDAVKVAEYMNNMNQHNITLGVSSSTLAEFQDMFKSPIIRQEWGVFVKDVMVCFAEAVGAIPYHLGGDALYGDENSLLGRIEDKIGIKITPSDIEGGLYKLKINNKFFVYRDFWSAYIAWRIHDLVGPNASIAEIGGGLGAVALYAGQFGIKDYSIYDLPIINLVQAWYLIKGGVDVMLYGEENESHSVKILPYWEFTNKKSFDLTLNADSFPEMDASIVTGYLETIKKNTKKYLLSINQEEAGEYGDGRRHVVVQDAVAKVSGLKRISRSPFWFLQNYAEELYTITE